MASANSLPFDAKIWAAGFEVRREAETSTNDRANGGSSKTSCFATTSSADYGALLVRSEPRKLPTPPDLKGAGLHEDQPAVTP
jgi:hypothetical protein